MSNNARIAEAVDVIKRAKVELRLGPSPYAKKVRWSDAFKTWECYEQKGTKNGSWFGVAEIEEFSEAVKWLTRKEDGDGRG